MALSFITRADAVACLTLAHMYDACHADGQGSAFGHKPHPRMAKVVIQIKQAGACEHSILAFFDNSI
jgi:hypothetical protein